MKSVLLTPYLHALITLFYLIWVPSAGAMLPSTLSYQAYVTDDTGVPINGERFVTFRLYTTESGGSLIWDEVQRLTIAQGLLHAQLGAVTPLNLPDDFDTPLFLGIEMDTDGEMSPRQSITLSGYAVQALNADTLDGQDATALDQSAHVADTLNPHLVTADQIGAADVSTLASHIGDTSNPHAVTAAQTGAASESDFTTHAANSAAHHFRYTNAEAVTAMGPKNDSSPLNHDKYTDANVLTTILANDGADSTLDSDKVDGFEAGELIDAAKDEVRKPISSLPYNINQSGSYYLTGNLDGSTGSININAPDVTLDLMGYTINGGGSISDYGIDFNGFNNVNVRNGTVKGFGKAGIYQSYTEASYATVMDVQVIGNGTLGATEAYSGIYIRSNNSHVERCTAGDNGGNGIYGYNSSKLVSNTAYNNGGNGIQGSSGSIISGNTAYSNGNNGIYGWNGSVITNNTAYRNNGSYGIYGGNGAMLNGNTAYNNSGEYGMYGSFGARLNDNTAYDNSGTGIYGRSASLSGNTAWSNDGNGIGVSDGSTVISNIAYSNGHWGIYTGPNALVKDNAINGNNVSNTADEGGLRVGHYNRVVGNALYGNGLNNIYVYGYDNSIENNQVVGSINGIFFNSSGNFFASNRASGNTNNYNLNGTSQTTSNNTPNVNF